MARPLLADPDLPRKAAEGREGEINTCIACNQGCLDRVFEGKRATCLVNPLAAYETELRHRMPRDRRSASPWWARDPRDWPAPRHSPNAVIESRCSNARTEIGGQFRYAREVPGKEDFHDTLRYFARRIELTGVTLAAQHRSLTRARWPAADSMTS